MLKLYIICISSFQWTKSIIIKNMYSINNMNVIFIDWKVVHAFTSLHWRLAAKLSKMNAYGKNSHPKLAPWRTTVSSTPSLNLCWAIAGRVSFVLEVLQITKMVCEDENGSHTLPWQQPVSWKRLFVGWNHRQMFKI